MRKMYHTASFSFDYDWMNFGLDYMEHGTSIDYDEEIEGTELDHFLMAHSDIFHDDLVSDGSYDYLTTNAQAIAAVKAVFNQMNALHKQYMGSELIPMIMEGENGGQNCKYRICVFDQDGEFVGDIWAEWCDY